MLARLLQDVLQTTETCKTTQNQQILVGAEIRFANSGRLI